MCSGKRPAGERALTITLVEMYVQGVSTRKVKTDSRDFRSKCFPLSMLKDFPMLYAVFRLNYT